MASYPTIHVGLPRQLREQLLATAREMGVAHGDIVRVAIAKEVAALRRRGSKRAARFETPDGGAAV